MNTLLESIQTLIKLSREEQRIVTTLFKTKFYKKGEFFLAEG